MKNVIAEKIRSVTSKSDEENQRRDGHIEDIQAIRKRARKHIEQGAVTDDYKADRNAVVSLLNDALATELVCVLRYKRHYFMATGLDGAPAAEEFLQHANEEQQHADDLASMLDGSATHI